MTAAVARVLAVVTLAAGAAVLTGPAAVAVPGGLLLALVLPGLAVTATLFRGRALNAVERTVLAPALSLAVLVVAGLLIYVSGYALNRPAWAGATVGVTLLALIVPGVPLPRRTAEQAAAEAARESEIKELAAAAKLALQGSSVPSGGTTAGPPAGDATRPLPPLQPVRLAQKPPLKRIARQLVPMVLVLTAGGEQTLSQSVPVTAAGTWTGTVTVGRSRTTVALYRSGDTTALRTLYLAAAE